MKLISAIAIGGLVILMALLTPNVGSATPMADIRYVETDIGGGFWQYEYIVFNTSDPTNDAGSDLYFVFLGFSTEISLQIISLPTDWDAIFNFPVTDYVDLVSISPGIPPDGNDIAPGAYLGGFVLQFDEKVENVAFDVTFANLLDPENPITSEGTTTPVPEPATILLLAAGITGLGFVRRRRLMSL
jgi:hypothetical protein